MPSAVPTHTQLTTGSPRTTWTTTVCDSLEKVFPDAPPRALDPAVPQHAFRGEQVSFQLAFLPPSIDAGSHPPVSVTVEGPASLAVRVSSVELVPATLLAFDGHDAGYLRDTAGLYPDLLRPLGPEGLLPFVGQWRACWVDVTPTAEAPAGPVTLTVQLGTAEEVLARHEVVVEVVAEELPPLTMVNTHWFHCDGLATYYGVEVWSDAHWQIVDHFMAAAAEVQINSILTPVWTPSLDTAVGHYRLSTQLVDVAEDASGHYTFDFSRLRRWMGLARANGIARLEVAHLFTQWGATATPAIMVQRDGRLDRAFGWDVSATDPSYRRLLSVLVPALRAVLAAEWGEDKIIWHVSDEPHGDQAATYRAAREVVDDLLDGCVVVDALSDFDLYTSGTVPVPVAATDAAAPFLEAGVDPLWLYYCVGQNRDVSNRFFAMPSARNRAIGLQLLATGAAGFLHWGFNFYNSVGSLRPVDPFREPDAGGGFPAGDAFLVYPGADGVAWPSLRSRVFTEAMNDIRLGQAVRDRCGAAAVTAVIDPDGDLSLTRYSLDPDHYRRVRAALVARLRDGR